MVVHDDQLDFVDEKPRVSQKPSVQLPLEVHNFSARFNGFLQDSISADLEFQGLRAVGICHN